MENQVAQCEALLKRHIPGFELDKLEELLLREGLEIPVVNPQVASATSGFQFQQPPSNSGFRGGPSNAAQQPPPPHPPGVYYPPNMMGPPPPGYMMPPYGPHFHPMQIPPPGYNPHIHPAFQQPPPGYPSTPHMPQVQPQPQPQSQTKTQPQPQAHRPETTKGLDPNGNDMSNTEVWYAVHCSIPSQANYLRHSPKTLVSHPSSLAISAPLPVTKKISLSAPTDFPPDVIVTSPYPEMHPNG